MRSTFSVAQYKQSQRGINLLFNNHESKTIQTHTCLDHIWMSTTVQSYLFVSTFVLFINITGILLTQKHRSTLRRIVSEYHELANVTHLARKRHLVPNRSLLVGVVYRAIISQISLFFDAIIYIEVGFVQCVKLLVSSCLVLCCDVRYDVCFVFAPNFFIDGLLFYLYILY